MTMETAPEIRGPSIEVSFRYDNQTEQTWHTYAVSRDTKRPFHLPKGAFDDAVYCLKFGGSIHQLKKLFILKRERRQVILNHFEECAKKMIDSIEEQEGWSAYGLLTEDEA